MVGGGCRRDKERNGRKNGRRLPPWTNLSPLECHLSRPSVRLAMSCSFIGPVPAYSRIVSGMSVHGAVSLPVGNSDMTTIDAAIHAVMSRDDEGVIITGNNDDETERQ